MIDHCLFGGGMWNIGEKNERWKGFDPPPSPPPPPGPQKKEKIK